MHRNPSSELLDRLSELGRKTSLAGCKLAETGLTHTKVVWMEGWLLFRLKSYVMLM